MVDYIQMVYIVECRQYKHDLMILHNIVYLLLPNIILLSLKNNQVMMSNKSNQKRACLNCNRDLTTIKLKSITCDNCGHWLLDKSSLDTKNQEERDMSIMGYNVLDSSRENGNKQMKYDVSVINDFVTEGLHKII